MRTIKILTAITASTLLFAGCANKEEPAKQVVAGAEATLAPVRHDAAIHAPDQLKPTPKANWRRPRTTSPGRSTRTCSTRRLTLNASVVAVKGSGGLQADPVGGRHSRVERLNANVPKDGGIPRGCKFSNLPKAKREAAKVESRRLKAVVGRGDCRVQRG